MTRSVWLRADDAVGDWEARKARVTAGLEAGVDWVLVDEDDVARVRELGDVDVAAFRAGADVDAIEETGDAAADAYVTGKDAEGDGTADLPDDLAGSADLTALRRDDRTAGAFVRILDEDYETLAERAAEAADYTLVVGEDWTVIPLENLIARIGEETTLVAGVETPEEARTAFETLELGADAVLLDADDPDAIRETIAVRDEAERETLDLSWATVTAVERVGSADRVCVDTGSLLSHDEGMLVGSMSRGLFFVHAETADSPYVAARPFRVNAGAVHAYVRVPGGETRYLSEVGSGDGVLVVDRDGGTREAVVGRAKIEHRPMFRVEAEVETGDGDEVSGGSGGEPGGGGGDGANGGGDRTDSGGGDEETTGGVGETTGGDEEASDDGVDRVETLLQNAETIKVATRDGRTAVTDLEVGDEVLVYYESGGRHFGEAVEESVVEQ